MSNRITINHMTENKPNDALDYQGKTERITQPGRIAGLLNQVMNLHGLLTVSLAGSQPTFISVIVNVDSASDTLAIDQLNPNEGHTLMVRNGEARIHANLQGVDLDFTARLKQGGNTRGEEFYTMHLPDVVLYRQQREYYRARVRQGDPISVRILRENGEELDGWLHDISVGGMGLICTPAKSRPLVQGEHIEGCEMRLPDATTIRCELEIRFVKNANDGPSHIVGAKFIGLTPAQENTISRFVAMLDREYHRKGLR